MNDKRRNELTDLLAQRFQEVCKTIEDPSSGDVSLDESLLKGLRRYSSLAIANDIIYGDLAYFTGEILSGNRTMEYIVDGEMGQRLADLRSRFMRKDVNTFQLPDGFILTNNQDIADFAIEQACDVCVDNKTIGDYKHYLINASDEVLMEIKLKWEVKRIDNDPPVDENI